VWTGEDLRDQERSSRPINRAGERRTLRRLQRLTDAPPNAAVDDVIVRAYAALARAPSALVVASLDDAAHAVLRPNMPGSRQRDNWSIPLPRTLEQLRRDELPRRVAAALNRRGTRVNRGAARRA